MKNITKLFSVLVLIFLIFSSAGCGYSRQTVIPGNLKTIYVETFKNKIPIDAIYAYEPGLEIKITNAVIRRLHRDGNLKVVSREEADAVLEGDLIEFSQGGLRFTGLERIEEYRLFVVVALTLREVKTGKVLWEEQNFSGDESYFVTGSRAGSLGDAADKAIDSLARNVVDRITEDW